MLSALGAINGMILTGTRIYAVWGADYPALAWLGVVESTHSGASRGDRAAGRVRHAVGTARWHGGWAAIRSMPH